MTTSSSTTTRNSFASTQPFRTKRSPFSQTTIKSDSDCFPEFPTSAFPKLPTYSIILKETESSCSPPTSFQKTRQSLSFRFRVLIVVSLPQLFVSFLHARGVSFLRFFSVDSFLSVTSTTTYKTNPCAEMVSSWVFDVPKAIQFVPSVFQVLFSSVFSHRCSALSEMRLRRLFQIPRKFAPGDGLRNALQRLRVGTAMTRDGREYEKQGHSCDSIVRDAEKELDDDNYLLFLMYKACRDHYCVRHVSLFSFVYFEEYEIAEYSACKTVEYLRTYQPDQVRDLVNDVSLLSICEVACH